MNKIVLVLAFVTIIIACTTCAAPTAKLLTALPASTNTSAPAFPTATSGSSDSATHTQDPARSRQQTSTPRPTNTPSLPTPTFNPASVVTRTPQRPAFCPIQKTWLVPDFSWSLKYDRFYSLKDAVLGFLNSGGVYKKLIEPVTLFSYVQDREITFMAEAIQQDVTGDGVPEIIMRDWKDFYVLGCQGGEYRILFSIGPNTTGFNHMVASLVATEDLNGDGVREMLIAKGRCGNCSGDDYSLVEWDGTTFSSLFLDQKYRSPYGMITQTRMEPGVVSVNGLASDDLSIHPAVLTDTDQNGIIELVLSGGIPSSYEAQYSGPWRVETVIFTWNGAQYIVTNWEADPPVFRFQAVQDGDAYTSIGSYDQAIESYQQAISDDSLDSWNATRQEYERRYHYAYYEGIIPPEPAPDLIEYARLAAYARFRIMLLAVIQGKINEAQHAYVTLQEEYPEGTEGFIYTDLARIFWDDYQEFRQMESACSQVIQQVYSNPEPYLEYLGNSKRKTHGAWSLSYQPEDICPLTAQNP
jgi:hypothetical protein